MDQPSGPSATTLQRLGLATVVTNVAIVVTGGAVRLSESGLGCPEWPTCEAGSVLPVESSGHQLIENGNRGFAAVVAAVAVAALIAALRRRPRRDDLVRPAILLVAGSATQVAVGGATVLTGLNPLIVATHFLISIGLIAAAVVFRHRVRGPAAPARVAVHHQLRQVEHMLLAVLAAVLTLGTLVTASGPHAGEPGTPRLGIDPELISRIHADGVFLLVGLTIALWFALRATPAPPQARRAATVLLAVTLAQGTVGYVQYFTGLPEVLVGAHMLGACLTWIAALQLWLRSRVPADVARDDVRRAAPPATTTLASDPT